MSFWPFEQSRLILIVVLTAIVFSNDLSFADKDLREAIKVKGDVNKIFEKTSALSLFFEPFKNNVHLENQKVDYDITKETVLRLGPYVLDQSSVVMNITREQGEFYELEFGFDLVKRSGAIYVVSFQWPMDYLKTGMMEIIDDRGNSLWQRQITDSSLQEWQDVISEQKNKKLFEQRKKAIQSRIIENGAQAKTQKNLNLGRAQNLSPIHMRASWGLAHRGFLEFPISLMTVPFRFCVSSDTKDSRLAVCSRRYNFQRTAGRYFMQEVSQDSRAKALVNDKSVSSKGTAIFLDSKIPIKFSATLKNGTYFEFVSHPREISVVDIVVDEDNRRLNIIGFGDNPMGQIDESFYADSVHWGFLNFMPTIGDLRKYWRASTAIDTPYLYLRGEGGAPFRQTFVFPSLPSRKARITLADTTTRSTYSDSVWVTGEVHPEIKVNADDTEVNRVDAKTFRWNFLTPDKGIYNKGYLNVNEDGTTWKAGYEIFRGYPAEISVRSDLLITNDLQVLVLGEIGFQYWFESILGWENYTLSRQRWGVAARYSDSLVSTGGDAASEDIEFSFANVDLKYRFSPGIWGRDPTVGLIFSAHQFRYFLPDVIDEEVTYGGGGVFWARSMPRFFDEIFNILPIFRYPKWVDWEFLTYPMPITKDQDAAFNFVMNFHGKVQWSPRFFGEGGFGIKTFKVNDFDTNKTAQPYIAYGKFGIGINF
jgi:hypothetical protein